MGKRRHNPEKRAFRGVSYRKGAKPVNKIRLTSAIKSDKNDVTEDTQMAEILGKEVTKEFRTKTAAEEAVAAARIQLGKEWLYGRVTKVGGKWEAKAWLTSLETPEALKNGGVSAALFDDAFVISARARQAKADRGDPTAS